MLNVLITQTEAWGFGLVTGLFDATPATPVPTKMPPVLPYIALTDGTVLGYSCGAWCAGPSGDGSDGAASNPALPFGGDVTACTTNLFRMGLCNVFCL